MQKSLSITSPGLDAGGAFAVTIPDQIIKTDQYQSRVTANVAIGAGLCFVPIADVTPGPGLKWWAGQTVRIADRTTPAGETQVIAPGGVNPATGQITFVGVTAAGYTTAAGAYLAFSANPSPRVKVTINQLPVAGASVAYIQAGWAVAYAVATGTVITVTCTLVDVNAGAQRFQVATSANVLGVGFTIDWDGE